MRKKVRFFLRRSSKVEIQTQRKIVVPFKLATLILLVLMFIISIILFLRSDLFQINKIITTSRIPNCATEEGIKLTAEAVGRSIIFFDTKLAREALLEKFYCMENVRLTKIYPSTLRIEVLERIPIAAAAEIHIEPTLAVATVSATPPQLLQATPSAFFALDKEGVIFENLATTSALPKVYFAQRLGISTKISDSKILWLLNFLESASNLNLVLTEFTKTQEGLIFARTADGIQLIMSADSNPKTLASSLQAILRQAKIEGANFKILDLRFAKPVIRY